MHYAREKSSAMRMITTHEQADFDAIASLWGVKLLDPEAIAVSPRRVNRNVRAFLMLYGASFDVLEMDDIPRKRIDGLTVVDTQAPPSMKGVHAKTSVHIIDHHPPGENLSEGWTYHIEEVGATATLLVEALQTRSIDPDSISSTLLLLGIYEDTGSLSYAGTTPRDVRACAWLLDHGASLHLAGDFLDHPLSNGQRMIYDRLLESAETHSIHGLSIIIARANADGLADEISTLAHKLRDVFDPDGLFVLVALDGNVQLVARSTSNLLDVGKVAERFGGGGHERAAAALIRNLSLDEICQDLLAWLENNVEPSVTVGEIMSRDPHLLHPDTTIGEAAQMMKRFGHEGYPVVEENRVLGLLTRRAVDRAMTHGLGDNPISQVMDAGELVVHLDDSVQHLQKVMIQYGWGQVPVADGETGEIIGIVTRTDLIKSIGAEMDDNIEPRLGERLEHALPAVRLKLLKLVARQAENHSAALYIVGGFVRDLLLDAPSVDFDLVVEGDAIGLARGLVDEYGGKVSSHRRFGTAKWQLDFSSDALRNALDLGGNDHDSLPTSLDFVSARTEFYTHPTALPSVHQGSIKLDLHRRDFTINTLALRLDGRYYGQLLDYWGGGRDLREGRIRVLHSLSFMDDPTRMLRAIRLEQRLHFKIGPRTMELLDQAIPLLDRVSGERIRNELDAVFDEAEMTAILKRLDEKGLLAAIHTGLRSDAWLDRRLVLARGFQPPGIWGDVEDPEKHFLYYALMLFRLDEDEALQVCDRLRFSLAAKRDVLNANQAGRFLIRMGEGGRPSEYVDGIEEMSHRSLIAAWIALDENPGLQSVIEGYFSTWRYLESVADGSTLREKGVSQGPIYSQILWKLRAGWLDGQISDPGQEEALLEALLKELRHGG